MFPTFAATLRFLAGSTDYERQAAPYSPTTYNLDRMKRLVSALGHPERQFSALHVAGTTGKGSVALMAEAILRRAGYRTGLYTSPHLTEVLERIRVGGRDVSRADFLWAMNRMERALRRLRPTFFETLTAAAFLVFARRRVEVAVVEVGLGGRLDATNVLLPAACAITRIDYDHTERLGRTLGKIAAEKAAIVKPGIPVVTGPQAPGALRAIRRRGEPLRARVGPVSRKGSGLRFTVRGILGAEYRLELPALGAHQAENAATAIALVEASGARVTPGQVRAALREIRLPGRVEIVSRRPWVIVDTAHNPVEARALAAAIRPLRRKRTILVFGALADKDAGGMLRALLPGADLAIFTRAESPRAADPAGLARLARGPAVTTGDVPAAVTLALRLARPADAVVITGSFYVAGEALRCLSRK